jgi:tetratricopeptide (TPR) repeat protein
MADQSSQPQQIALQNVTANVIRIGSISQTINYTQKSISPNSVVNEGLPPLPSAEIWQLREEQTQVEQLLRRSDLRLIGLNGAGGYGKSATIAQVCKTQAEGLDQKLLWVNFQLPVDFRDFALWVIRSLVEDVQYEAIRDTFQVLDEAALCQEILNRLTKQRCLLVMDNLETLFQSEDLWKFYGDFLDGWLGHDRATSKIILTSQFRLDLPNSGAWQWLELRGLKEVQGVALLVAEKVIGEEKDLAAFARAADGHPLLLTLAVNLLKRKKKNDDDQPEILRLGQDAVSMLREIVEAHRGDSDASVGKVLDASFERLYPSWARVLLWRLSMVRGSFGLEMAQGMVEESLELGDLRRLVRWSFLQEEKVEGEWRFDFLPLIGRYLQLGAQEQEQLEIAHERAIGYYSANCQAWDGTIASCREDLEGFYHACELGQYGRAKGILDRCVEMLDRAGQWRSLLPLYQRLTTEWQAADNTEAETLGWAWTRLGGVQQNLGDYRSAIAVHEQAKAIFDQIEFPQGQAASLGNLGAAYFSLGQYQRAIDFYLQHNEIAREISDRGGEAKSLGNLGSAYQLLGQYQQAIDFHLQSLEITREIGDRSWEAGTLGNLGNVYSSLGQYQRAIDFHLQSNEIAQEIGDRGGEAKSLGNLGAAYQSVGQYQHAIDFHLRSLEIKREIGDRGGEANSLGSLGIAYDSLSQYQRAIDLHLQYNEIAREIGDRGGEAKSLGNLGAAYESLGQYQRAIDFHLQHNEIAREIGDRGGEANSLGNLGLAYESLGQYQRAIDFHLQHNEIAREIGDRRGEGGSLFNMANALAKLDNHAQALLNFQTAQSIYEELDLDHMVEQCKQAIRNINQIIAPKHKAPPTIALPQKPPQNDLLEKHHADLQRKANRSQTQRSSSNNFWLWFAAGLLLVILICWLKR